MRIFRFLKYWWEVRKYPLSWIWGNSNVRRAWWMAGCEVTMEDGIRRFKVRR